MGYVHMHTDQFAQMHQQLERARVYAEQDIADAKKRAAELEIQEREAKLARLQLLS